MSIEEAIREFTSLSVFDKNSGCVKASVDHQQIANWLQELKERREKEQRGIEIIKPYLTVQVDKDMVNRIIDETIDNLFFECENCGAKMFPQRKEEES